MTNQFDERISSLLDGELDEQERQQTLTVLEKNPELRGRWERYHLASDAIRHNLPAGIDTGFAARVMQALEGEPTVLAPPPVKAVTTPSPFTKRLAGVAVAASVAAVAVFGVQTLNRDTSLSAQQQMAQVPAVNLGEKAVVQVAGNPSQPSSPQTVHYFDPSLNKYLVDHNQQAARAGIQGMMPYARIVAYPAGNPQDPRQ
jgi:sigma-E factor negative regulatory protein RseA